MVGKIVGFLFFIVVLVFACLSYARFVLGLELKSVAKKLATKADLDDVVPDFSYKTYSPYDVPVEDHHLSCHWHEKSS